MSSTLSYFKINIANLNDDWADLYADDTQANKEMNSQPGGGCWQRTQMNSGGQDSKAMMCASKRVILVELLYRMAHVYCFRDFLGLELIYFC